MPQDTLRLLKMAHSTSLLGYERPAREEMLGAYLQLGDDKVPYDLNYPAALNELKQALYRLGLYHSGDAAAPSTEKRWASINIYDVDFPGWDAGAADEFAIAIGRYRGLGWQVSEPYTVDTLNGPSPTATGLELIAGACRTLLKDFVMSVYEQWRGGMISPPSVVSGPKATDPVVAPQFFGAAYKYVPEGTRPDLLQQITQLDAALKTYWGLATGANDEASRATIATQIETYRAQREQLVNTAIAEAPVRQGATTVESLDQAACDKAQGKWNAAGAYCDLSKPSAIPSWVWWTALPVGAAAVYWYSTKRKGAHARPNCRSARRRRR